MRHPLFERALSIRGAGDGDRPALRALYASTREDELAAVPWPPDTKQAFLAQQFALQHHHYVTRFPGADFLVVCRASDVVGRLYRDRAPAEAPPEACDAVIDVCLRPEWRGRGLGTALLRGVMDSAESRGRGVALHVLALNEGARRLYERLGFTVTATSAPYLAMRWQARPPQANTAW